MDNGKCIELFKKSVRFKGIRFSEKKYWRKVERWLTILKYRYWTGLLTSWYRSEVIVKVMRVMKR